MGWGGGGEGGWRWGGGEVLTELEAVAAADVLDEGEGGVEGLAAVGAGVARGLWGRADSWEG